MKPSKSAILLIITHFLLAGSLSAQSFTQQTQFPVGSDSYESSHWGDYDNDGDLDILMTGGMLKSAIYRNNGDQGFEEQTQFTLMGLYWGDAAWSDYDSDGDLDILITGIAGLGGLAARSAIYRNNGDNTFTQQTDISLTGVKFSSIVWEDTDNDGDPDILMSGLDSSDILSCKLYRNDRNNQFTEMNPNIVPISNIF
jgi:hypothetical protein